MLKYSEQTRTRIQDGIRRYSRIVSKAKERGMNERDTGDIARAVLGNMLGYDPFFDVTAESTVRGPHSDFAVLNEEKVQFLVIVKAIGVSPHAAHLLGLSGITVPPYAEWALVTNAESWACYRLGVGLDRHAELVFRVGLNDAMPMEEKTMLFFLLSKEAAQQNALLQHWEQVRVLHPGRLAALLLSDESLHLLRREIQRRSSYRVDVETIREALIRDVLRAETLRAEQNAASGLNFPHCFAYAPDMNHSATWRLPYRNPDNTPNPELLTLATAELSRDMRALEIPADDLSFVRERLRQAYLELGIAPEDIPLSLSAENDN